MTLSRDVLSGAGIEFGPVAAVIGADHQFAVTDQGHPTERYFLASTFGTPRPDRPGRSPAGIVVPEADPPTINMQHCRELASVRWQSPKQPGGSPP